MTKALGLAFALTLALTLPSAAEETTRGTVQTVDRADQSIVLDDGTQLWVVSGAPINEVTPGDQVRARSAVMRLDVSSTSGRKSSMIRSTLTRNACEQTVSAASLRPLGERIGTASDRTPSSTS